MLATVISSNINFNAISDCGDQFTDWCTHRLVNDRAANYDPDIEQKQHQAFPPTVLCGGSHDLGVWLQRVANCCCRDISIKSPDSCHGASGVLEVPVRYPIVLAIVGGLRSKILG